MSVRTPPRTRPDYAQLVLAVVFVWGAGDLFSTFLALHVTSVAFETNPLVRALLAHHPLLVVAMKGATAMVVGLAPLQYRSVVERVPLWRWWFVGVLVAGSAVVVTTLYVAFTAAGV